MSRNSEDALRQIIKRFERNITHIAFSILKDSFLAKEVMMYTIQKAWDNREKLATFDLPTAWLYRVAINKAINIKNQCKRRQQINRNYYFLNKETDHPQQLIEAKDLLAKLQTMIDLLPPKEKEVFILNVMQGYNTNFLALFLNRSASTIRTQRIMALKKIRTYFGECYRN